MDAITLRLLSREAAASVRLDRDGDGTFSVDQSPEAEALARKGKAND